MIFTLSKTKIKERAIQYTRDYAPIEHWTRSIFVKGNTLVVQWTNLNNSILLTLDLQDPISQVSLKINSNTEYRHSANAAFITKVSQFADALKAYTKALRYE